MSFLKKVAGAFVEMEDEDSKPSKKIAKVDYDDNPTNFQMPKDDSEKVSASSSKVDTEKFKNHFKNLMKEADLPGPDYYDYAETKRDLAEDIPSEDARIKTANKVHKIPVPKLIESANYYIEIVNKDKENFLKSVSEKEESEIKGRENMIAQLSIKMESNTKTISSLEKENESIQQQIFKLEDEKKVAEEKIKVSQVGYVQAAEEFVDCIKNDVSKIQTLLK